MVHLAIILRGHERDTFESPRLNSFVLKLSDLYPDDEFVACIHTWNKSEANLSWRTLHKDRAPITEEDVCDYFDIPVVCKVDDEDRIPFRGSTEGKFGAIPIVCWKRMWYGQQRGVDLLTKHLDTAFGKKYNARDVVVVNMRLDFFDCATTAKYNLNEKTVIDRIKLAVKTPQKYTFFKDSGEYDGIDNMIISSLPLMQRLVGHFHLNLDKIVPKYKYLFFHENSVFYEAEELLGNRFKESPLDYMAKLAVNSFGAYTGFTTGRRG